MLRSTKDICIIRNEEHEQKYILPRNHQCDQVDYRKIIIVNQVETFMQIKTTILIIRTRRLTKKLNMITMNKQKEWTMKRLVIPLLLLLKEMTL